MGRTDVAMAIDIHTRTALKAQTQPLTQQTKPKRNESSSNVMHSFMCVCACVARSCPFPRCALCGRCDSISCPVATSVLSAGAVGTCTAVAARVLIKPHSPSGATDRQTKMDRETTSRKKKRSSRPSFLTHSLMRPHAHTHTLVPYTDAAD
mmetsp:Transcript_25001/g.61850  ORF Transcript_25001/g.61850 Transcript_25001/m.61850 type:complete len:151 (-) Transcript_25001:82-534(-)